MVITFFFFRFFFYSSLEVLMNVHDLLQKCYAMHGVDSLVPITMRLSPLPPTLPLRYRLCSVNSATVGCVATLENEVVPIGPGCNECKA